jgi:hypothetical protein
MAVKFGLLAQLEAKPGKGEDLPAFLEGGRALALAENGTVTPGRGRTARVRAGHSHDRRDRSEVTAAFESGTRPPVPRARPEPVADRRPPACRTPLRALRARHALRADAADRWDRSAAGDPGQWQPDHTLAQLAHSELPSHPRSMPWSPSGGWSNTAAGCFSRSATRPREPPATAGVGTYSTPPRAPTSAATIHG